MRYDYDDYAYMFGIGFVTVVFGLTLGVTIGVLLSGY